MRLTSVLPGSLSWPQQKLVLIHPGSTAGRGTFFDSLRRNAGYCKRFSLEVENWVFDSGATAQVTTSSLDGIQCLSPRITRVVVVATRDAFEVEGYEF